MGPPRKDRGNSQVNRIYDRDGNPITHERWNELLNDRDYVVVKQEELDEGHWISTVWLGLDHSYGHINLRIFETMIFKRSKDSMENYNDVECRRYATLQEAQKGHEALKREWHERTKTAFLEAMFQEEGGEKE